MMRSMYSAVSGLRNHQTRQDVIGNNIANVNTTAFKYSTANFQDILSQTLQSASAANGSRGGTNPMQVGLGMGVASISTNFTDGSFQPTGNNANLGIQGQGFFILADGSEQIYSRAGNFDFDTNGNYIMNGTGYKVQGWMADTNGNIKTSSNISPLCFPKGMTMPGKATEQVNFAYNLSKDAEIGSTGMGAITVYDTYGSPHKLTANFIKVSDNNWLYQATGNDGNILPGTQMGVITFDGSGKVSSVKTIIPPTVNTGDQTINFQSLQLDNVTGSSKTGYFTVYDKNNMMHNYETQVTNIGTDSSGIITWNYSVSEAGVTGGTPVAVGTFTYNPSTNVYTQSNGVGIDSFSLAGQKITLDFLSGTEAPPDVDAFAFKQSSPFSETTNYTIDNMELDGTKDAVHYKYLTAFDVDNIPHALQMKITTQGTGGPWKYEVTEPGVSDSTTAAGNITYDSSIPTYNIDSFALNDLSISFTVNSATTGLGAGTFAMKTNMPYGLASSQADIMYVPVNGQSAMNIAFDFSDITQFSSGTSGTNGTTITALSQDGYAQGTLESLNIDSSGIIVGKFTNERQQNLAQIALATFNNPNGLLKKGDTIFTKTSNSGEAQIGGAGTGSRGTINPGTLEMSNVDLAQEFTNMITTQRGFQANSKIISVDDEMLQELVNLKR